MHSTYFGGSELNKHYTLDSEGKLNLKMAVEQESFFKSREYFCDDDFTCNHDSSISCYATNSDGSALLNESKCLQVLRSCALRCL